MRVAGDRIYKEGKCLLRADVVTEFQRGARLPKKVVPMCFDISSIKIMQEVARDFVHLLVVVAVKLGSVFFFTWVLQCRVDADRCRVAGKHG